MHDNPRYVQPVGRFRKRPVEIDAMRWDGGEESQRAIVNAFGGAVSGWVDNAGYFLQITTLEGTMIARAGDWIVRGVQGELYPVKPDIFDATYEAIDDAR